MLNVKAPDREVRGLCYLVSSRPTRSEEPGPYAPVSQNKALTAQGSAMIHLRLRV